MTVKEKAYAKINISLDVVGRRPDGYHEMIMTMQTVSLCDELTIRFEGDSIRARTNLRYVPCDERNLAVRAASAPGVDFVALSLNSADPNEDNASVDDCAAVRLRGKLPDRAEHAAFGDVVHRVSSVHGCV